MNGLSCTGPARAEEEGGGYTACMEEGSWYLEGIVGGCGGVKGKSSSSSSRCSGSGDHDYYSYLWLVCASVY